MPNATTDRIHHTIRWVAILYERVEELAADLGISKNDAFNVLVREALDARDARVRWETADSRTPAHSE